MRFIHTVEELQTVALLCMDNPHGTGCHTKFEHAGHEAMFEGITQIIQNRTNGEYQ
jgi:hypothetical protein